MQVELARGTIVVPRGTTYSSTPPPPLIDANPNVNKENLVAIVTVRLASSEVISNVTTVPEGVLGDASIKLDFETAVSHPVSPGTSLNFEAADGDYLLFTFYERAVGKIAAYGGFNGTDAMSESCRVRLGSRMSAKPCRLRSVNNTWTTYQADHWSTAGAKAVINVLENSFVPTLGEYWKADVGYVVSSVKFPGEIADRLPLPMSSKYLWEDSLEIPTEAVNWTPGLLDTIRSQRGIDLERYLPFLYANATAGALDPHYGPWVSRWMSYELKTEFTY